MEFYIWKLPHLGLTLHHLKSNITNIVILVEITIT